MNSLISINNKFMDISPKDLVSMILNFKYTKGVEVYINPNEEKELKYLEGLVFELRKNSLILQIHGEIELDYATQIKYMNRLERYSDELNMPIIVTFHTLFDDDKSESINKTIDYLSSLYKDIDNNKIIISLENLNDIRGYDRIGKDEIKNTILNDEGIYFTYDIGHEISNFGNITDIDSYLIDDIRNVHLHSIDEVGNDHKPIYNDDLYWNEIIKAIAFLILCGYKYNIVYEYGIEYCKGNTLEDKVKDYLSSIDLVSERYGK